MVLSCPATGTITDDGRDATSAAVDDKDAAVVVNLASGGATIVKLKPNAHGT